MDTLKCSKCDKCSLTNKGILGLSECTSTIPYHYIPDAKVQTPYIVPYLLKTTDELRNIVAARKSTLKCAIKRVVPPQKIEDSCVCINVIWDYKIANDFRLHSKDPKVPLTKDTVWVIEGMAGFACPKHELRFNSVSTCLTITCFFSNGMRVGVHEPMMGERVCKGHCLESFLHPVIKTIGVDNVVHIDVVGILDTWYFPKEASGGKEFMSRAHLAPAALEMIKEKPLANELNIIENLDMGKGKVECLKDCMIKWATSNPGNDNTNLGTVIKWGKNLNAILGRKGSLWPYLNDTIDDFKEIAEIPTQEEVIRERFLPIEYNEVKAKEWLGQTLSVDKDKIGIKPAPTTYLVATHWITAPRGKTTVENEKFPEV